MKRNKKRGFTLVELLAVIVVLAIIMVIATQQINKTINRSRAKSFNETMNIIVENARILFAEGGIDFVCGAEDTANVSTSNVLSGTNLHASLDYNGNDYQVKCEGTSNTTAKITLKATETGKFKLVDTSLITASADLKNDKFYYDKADKSICTIIKNDGTFEACPASTTSSTNSN